MLYAFQLKYIPYFNILRHIFYREKINCMLYDQSAAIRMYFL